MGTTSTPRLVLRDLPISARLVLSAFLLSVGLGYASALVQVHFKHASKGEFLPGPANAIATFHGGDKRSKIEQLIDADPSASFSKNGQMRDAFFKGVDGAAERRAKNRNIPVAQAKELILKEREGERLGMLAWLKAGAKQDEFEKGEEGCFPFPKDWDPKQPVTKDYKDENGNLRIQSLFTDRCFTCHNGAQKDKGVPQMDTYPLLTKYLEVKDTRMDLDSLAQTTHVHLLGFSMLYGLTGLILAFSGLPVVVRCVLCPLPLVAQVAEIGCWWLVREAKPYGPMFASAIPITGGIVAMGLFAHIMLGLFTMYDWKGKLVLVLLFAGAGAGGYFYLKPIVENLIREEKASTATAAPGATTTEEKKPDEGNKGDAGP